MIGLILGRLKWAALVAGMGAVAVVVFMIRQMGVDAEKLKQAKADLRAGAAIQKSRNEARSASPEELDGKVDRWTRK